MAQKKEHLEKLLIKLDEWANEKGSEWFKEELLRKFGKNHPIISNNIENKIDFIQSYLMLDNLRCLDYSDIKEEKVRNQLTLDCIMMARFKAGKIDNIPNFEEFCRYAHYQAEEIINYYFHLRHKSSVKLLIEEINKTKDKDNQYVPSTKQFPKSISDIPYWFKVDLLATICKVPNKFKEDIKILKNLRNILSHRDSFSNRDESILYTKFKEKKFHLFDDTRDLTKLSTDDRKIFNEGKVIFFLREKNFDIVFEALCALKTLALTNVETKLIEKPILLFGKEVVLK